MKIFLLFSLSSASAYTLTEYGRNTSDGYVVTTNLKARDPTTDIYDYSWIKNWAAIGDSFTAGIGSGNPLSESKSDTDCSRYDYSYPSILNRFFGGSIQSFQYPACSGATSADIYNQVSALPNNLDLVVLSAGGNDLCLTSIISNCILNSLTSESSCSSSIQTAQNFIDNQLESNIDEILTNLDSKMGTNGIVVYALYAKYFNDQTDGCTSENWWYPFSGAFGITLTPARRTALNALVDNANKVVRRAIADATGSSRPRTFTVQTADWDPWLDTVPGRFCEPGASPDPDDSSNANLQFFKFDTTPYSGHDGLKRRDLDAYANMTQAMMEAEAYSMLSIRDPTPPNCPKSLASWLFGGYLPDSIGKIFHPNTLGHETIASFVLNAISVARAKQLGLPAPGCEAQSTLTCHQKQGSHAYATDTTLYNNVNTFCSWANGNVPSGTANWKLTQPYNQGTLDENSFTVSASNGAQTFDQNQCNTAMTNILSNCDGNDPNNPLDWKFGGTLVEGSYTYSIDIKRTNRPWPVPKVPTQSCHGQYWGVLSAYDIYGTGFSSWDNGQTTLAPAIKSCIGGGLTKYSLTYFDAPDSNGYEWKAHFQTPIWTSARCFNNNKVQRQAAGNQNVQGGCSGSG